MSQKKFQSNRSDDESISVSLVKIVSAASVVLGLFVGLASVGSTVSYFSNGELSLANVLRAGTVSLALSTTGDQVARVASIAPPEESVGEKTFEFGVNTQESTIPVLYEMRAFLAPESPLQCADIHLVATLGEYHYDGPLLNFLLTQLEQSGWWSFNISIPASSTLPYDALCEGEVVAIAHVAGVAQEIKNVFTDEKEYYFSLRNVSAPTLVAPPASQEVPGEEVSISQEIVDTAALDANETTMTDEKTTPVGEPTPAPEPAATPAPAAEPAPAPETPAAQ